MPRSLARLNAMASGSGGNAAAAAPSSVQSNNITIPLANPELDQQLDLKSFKPKRGNVNLVPRFPSFHDLPRAEMLLTEDEVEDFRESFRGPPYPGYELDPHSSQERIRDIYHSIIETRYARDHDGRSPVDRNRTAGSYYYGPKLVLTIAMDLAIRLLVGPKEGFMQSNDEAQEDPGPENISPPQRHRELCLVLLFEKSIVEEVLRGDKQKITNLVAGPASYALRKQEVRSWVANILEASRAAGNVVNPALPAAPLNDSVPAYPTFEEVQSGGFQDVKMDYLESFERLPLVPEERIDWLKENKLYLVIKLYDAICSVSDMRSKEERTNGAHFDADLGPFLSPRTSPKTIQEACWRIVTAFLDGVEHGFVKPKMPNRRERELPAKLEKIPWNVRFSTMLTMLSRRKALCWRLVKSSHGLDCFIVDPYLFRNLGVSDGDPPVTARNANQMQT